MLEDEAKDKAGKGYWDNAWEDAALPGPVNPNLPGLNNYVNRRFHEYFQGVFSKLDTPQKKLLEIGCAKSAWLPYFAKEFGFRVSGIDYSSVGCSKAQQVLQGCGIKGDIYCADFYAPPNETLERFDVVVSFGVAEHFEDTAACIRALARFLGVGGIMITVVPNLSGLPGLLQKRLDREVYDIHVPVDRAALEQAHKNAGLQVISCDYLMPINLAVLNKKGEHDSRSGRMFVRLRSWVSKAVWFVDGVFPVLRANRITSPYVVCLAKHHRHR
jgi:2-polyprenyl-3-methyl-5-hydroxy-6-metoxy-1,4-benzoquinol methylase